MHIKLMWKVEKIWRGYLQYTDRKRGKLRNEKYTDEV